MPALTRRFALAILLYALLQFLADLYLHHDILPQDSAGFAPQYIALVSMHGGSKFFGLGPALRANKVEFARQHGCVTVFGEDVLTDPDWTGLLRPVPEGTVNWDWMKYRLVEAAFKRWLPLRGAIWVDGDAWLWPGRRTFDEYLELAAKRDFLVGRDHNGLSLGVIWLARSPQASNLLADVLGLLGNRTDTAFFEERVGELEGPHMTFLAANESAVTQCRKRCGRAPNLCCTGDSWNVQWPAHSWHDILLRIVEIQLGSKVVTRAVRSLERVVCVVATTILGPSLQMCRHVL